MTALAKFALLLGLSFVVFIVECWLVWLIASGVAVMLGGSAIETHAAFVVTVILNAVAMTVLTFRAIER